MSPDRDMLEAELHDLAQRVARLEEALGLATHPAAVAPAPGPTFEAAAMLPVLGRALLGLAGAYLLRALSESGTVGPKIGVGAGLIYAIFWLVWAARTPAERRMEAALHSLTSVLILSPLLWEATLRFHAVSPAMAGGILLAFTVFGLAISWRKNLLVVATIATVAGLGTAAALLIATHDVLPFTFVFLAIAAAVEASACLDHWLSERWLAAAAADLAVLLATWLVTNARGLPAGYAPIPHGWLVAAQVTLLVLYLGSTAIRTLFRGFRFTVFETAQLAIVFAIGVNSGMAAAVLACGVVCYPIAAFTRERNFHTYATFAILLTAAGSWMLLPIQAAQGVWAVLALICWWAGGKRVTFQAHGIAYLLLALLSGQILATAAIAGVCYWLAIRHDAPHATRLGAAAILAWLLASIATGLVAAPLRTSVFSFGALLLAWAGARWNALELSRLIYPTMLVGAYRLLTDDLRQDRKSTLFLTLLVYGAVLIVLPRLRRSRATVSGSECS